MNMLINDIINAITSRIGHDVGSVSEILAMLIMTTVFTIYEFVVYRLISKKSMYNKSFHISLTVIPYFIGAIVMALQSNLVITLGTIGALAIIRYRTAIKDPIDMVYVLWSVFIGISVGCQLYELCLLTSLVVTIVLLIINLLCGDLIRSYYVLVINSLEDNEVFLTKIIKENSKSYHLKSRNFTSTGVDYVYEIDTKCPTDITKAIKELKSVSRFSLIEYDSEDIM